MALPPFAPAAGLGLLALGDGEPRVEVRRWCVAGFAVGAFLADEERGEQDAGEQESAGEAAAPCALFAAFVVVYAPLVVCGVHPFGLLA